MQAQGGAIGARPGGAKVVRRTPTLRVESPSYLTIAPVSAPMDAVQHCVLRPRHRLASSDAGNVGECWPEVRSCRVAPEIFGRRLRVRQPRSERWMGPGVQPASRGPSHIASERNDPSGPHEHRTNTNNRVRTPDEHIRA